MSEFKGIPQTVAQHDEPQQFNTKPTTYLVVGRHIWGKGKTEKQAVRKALSQGHGDTKTRLVYLTNDPDAYVDDMGNITRQAGSQLILIRKVKEGKEQPLDD